MRLPTVLALAILSGAVVWLAVETRRLAELAGRAEVEARHARADADAARAAAAVAPAAGGPSAPSPAAADGAVQDPVAYARLSLELAATKDQLAAVTALLAQRNREAEQRAAEAAAVAEKLAQPMPDGVRLCLQALHDCLRAEGFTGLRFLGARSVGNEGLTMVEALECDPSGLDVAVLHAARVTATLDRSRGRFELRFFDGERVLRGERQKLPKDGFAIAFDDVDGRPFEARLPYLLAVQGAYPDSKLAEARAATDLEPPQRRQWLARLDRVLRESGVSPGWQVTRLRGLDNAWFLAGELVSADEKKRVVGGAHVARFAIECDQAAGVVSLLLRDGFLHRAGVDSRITGEGFRVLLPNLTCKQANDLMFGMVVTK